MRDELDIIKNLETIYDSNNSFSVLKDFERVLDHLGIYVYKNWIDGELVEGPVVRRHWVKCAFMWPREDMPDPEGGKRLLDYDCSIKYERTHLIEPRKIEKPDDLRPGTQKGKLDRVPVWVVSIEMPKMLISEIYNGYIEGQNTDNEPDSYVAPESQSADIDNSMSGQSGEIDL